jgi:CRISPR/Cas system CMR-associated protein Cmr1 (group 7 of RAMP superfamily)
MICFNNETIPCIRIRGLDNYELIEDLQKCFFSEGIKFLKKKNIKSEAVITLKKLYDIEPIEDNIFKDNDEPSTFYIKISRQLSYEQFRKITFRVKNNIDKDLVNFDAALAAIYTKEVMDVVRIYAKDTDPEKLRIILRTYEEELEKMP